MPGAGVFKLMLKQKKQKWFFLQCATRGPVAHCDLKVFLFRLRVHWFLLSIVDRTLSDEAVQEKLRVLRGSAQTQSSMPLHR